MMQTDATDQKFENWLASEHPHQKHHEEIYKEVRAAETVLSSTRKSEVAQNWQGPILFYREETKPSITAD